MLAMHTGTTVHTGKKLRRYFCLMYFSLLPLAIEGDSVTVQPDLAVPRNEETDRARAVIPRALATRVVMNLQG